MENDKDIRGRFSKKFADSEALPEPGTWSAIESRLDSKPPRRFPFFWFFAGLGLLTAITGMFIFLLPDKTNPIADSVELKEKSAGESPEARVKIITPGNTTGTGTISQAELSQNKPESGQWNKDTKPAVNAGQGNNHNAGKTQSNPANPQSQGSGNTGSAGNAGGSSDNTKNDAGKTGGKYSKPANSKATNSALSAGNSNAGNSPVANPESTAVSGKYNETGAARSDSNTSSSAVNISKNTGLNAGALATSKQKNKRHLKPKASLPETETVKESSENNFHAYGTKVPGAEPKKKSTKKKSRLKTVSTEVVNTLPSGGFTINVKPFKLNDLTPETGKITENKEVKTGETSQAAPAENKQAEPAISEALNPVVAGSNKPVPANDNGFGAEQSAAQQPAADSAGKAPEVKTAAAEAIPVTDSSAKKDSDTNKPPFLSRLAFWGDIVGSSQNLVISSDQGLSIGQVSLPGRYDAARLNYGFGAQFSLLSKGRFEVLVNTGLRYQQNQLQLNVTSKDSGYHLVQQSPSSVAYVQNTSNSQVNLNTSAYLLQAGAEARLHVGRLLYISAMGTYNYVVGSKVSDSGYLNAMPDNLLLRPMIGFKMSRLSIAGGPEYQVFMQKQQSAPVKITNTAVSLRIAYTLK
ncbi:MAG: hypothetical protein V4543_15690 [Bacteroidota bacterium]